MDTRKIAMQQKVKNCMEESLETWSGVLEMEKVYDQFIKNLKKIDALFPETQVNLSPMEENVISSKEKLISILLPTNKVLSVFAFDAGWKKLGKRAKVTSAQLVRMKAGDLEKHAFAIWTAIDEIVNNEDETERNDKSVFNYGLTTKMIDSLFQTATQYANLRHSLKEAKKTNKKAEKQINKLIKENNKLLKERLDKFMFLFEESSPGFFNCYTFARKNKPIPVNNEDAAG